MDGLVLSQSRNVHSGEVLTMIYYSEDDDKEKLNATGLIEEIGNFVLDEDSLIIFEGPLQNDEVGLIITTANNPGLGYDNPFHGTRSFEEENGKQNKN